MSIFDKISSLITGSKPEKREPEKVSSSTDETPIVVVENPTQIKGPKPKMVIVVTPVINKPTKLHGAAPKSREVQMKLSPALPNSWEVQMKVSSAFPGFCK
ncbi:MAG: hypothetical protein KBT20_03205 [Bacteroidales bacterium]|nr:hypothetical protein [Candidatus Liminaster caballi]